MNRNHLEDFVGILADRARRFRIVTEYYKRRTRKIQKNRKEGKKQNIVRYKCLIARFKELGLRFLKKAGIWINDEKLLDWRGVMKKLSAFG